MNIDNYSNYTLNTNLDVIKTKDNKQITKQISTNNTYHYKMKDDLGKWNSISRVKVMSLAGVKMKLHPTAVRIYDGYEYYIDISGEVTSFQESSPTGLILKTSIGASGYPKVNLFINGKATPKTVHSLLCNAFIVKGYEKLGLVCLHNDDDKLNFKLTNLSVGTYSKNNKDAYTNLLIPSKKGSSSHGEASRNRVCWESFDLEKILEDNKYVVSKASRVIGCSDNGLKARMRKVGLQCKKL